MATLARSPLNAPLAAEALSRPQPTWWDMLTAASDLAAAAEAHRPLPRAALIQLGLDAEIADRQAR